MTRLCGPRFQTQLFGSSTRFGLCEVRTFTRFGSDNRRPPKQREALLIPGGISSASEHPTPACGRRHAPDDIGMEAMGTRCGIALGPVGPVDPLTDRTQRTSGAVSRLRNCPSFSKYAYAIFCVWVGRSVMTLPCP